MHETNTNSFNVSINAGKCIYTFFCVHSGAYSRGGIWGICPPPLEPNAQRKNLRRLRDLRGTIQRKSPKLST